MEHRFDSLAKAVSGAISRREAFRRLGSGLTVGVLSFFGLGFGNPGDCARCCVETCLGLDPPPRGEDMAACITECLENNPEGQTSTFCVPFCS